MSPMVEGQLFHRLKGVSNQLKLTEVNILVLN